MKIDVNMSLPSQSNHENAFWSIQHLCQDWVKQLCQLHFSLLPQQMDMSSYRNPPAEMLKPMKK